MTTEERAKQYQQKRDSELAQKLQETLDYLDKEELTQALLNRILHKFHPKLNEITKPLIEVLESRIQEITVQRIEELINKSLERVFDSKLEKKIEEMIDEELDRRFKQIIKNDEY